MEMRLSNGFYYNIEHLDCIGEYERLFLFLFWTMGARSVDVGDGGVRDGDGGFLKSPVPICIPRLIVYKDTLLLQLLLKMKHSIKYFMEFKKSLFLSHLL